MPVDPRPPASGEDHRAASYDDAAVPRDLKVRMAEQKLTVLWRDGVVSEFPFTELRRQCPCATCRTEREQRKATLLPILKADPSGAMPHVVNARLVGKYAIQFYWSDGHDTGIFDFRFLRTLASGTTTTASVKGQAP